MMVRVWLLFAALAVSADGMPVHTQQVPLELLQETTNPYGEQSVRTCAR